MCSLAGQLKSLFEDFGRKSEWVDCGTVKYGNPVSSKVVSRYIEAVKLEQSTAHVPIKQAKPLFLNKLKKLGHHINKTPSQISSSFEIRCFLSYYFFLGTELMI